MDQSRADFVTDLLIFRLSSFVPFYVTVYDSCPNGLKFMSNSILGLKSVSNEITDTITKVNVTIRARITDDAVIRLPISDRILKIREIVSQHIYRYFRWLRTNFVRIVKNSRDMEIKRALPAEIRARLKSEDYPTSSAVVRVFEMRYKQYLKMLQIPLQSLQVST